MWLPYMILSDRVLCKEIWEKVIRRIRLQGIFYLTLGTYEIFLIWSKSAISLFGNYFHRIHIRFMNLFLWFITRWFPRILCLDSIKLLKSFLKKFLIYYDMISRKIRTIWILRILRILISTTFFTSMMKQYAKGTFCR